MGYGVRMLVWGDYACFSRPELKVERVSYDFITPSAARGVLEAVYWKPAIIWVIDKIHVLNPIQFTNIRRNEVADVAKLSGIKKAAQNLESYEIIATDSRQQRAAMILTNVAYVIEAHFEMNSRHAGESDTPEKHYNIVLRRLRQGQFFHKPFLGTREFGASFRIIEEHEEIPKSSLEGEQDFGYMLLDMNYSLGKKGDSFSVSPKFFKARTVNGVCDLTNLSGVVS